MPKVLTADTGRGGADPCKEWAFSGTQDLERDILSGVESELGKGAELAAETGRMQTGRAVCACTRTHHWHQGVLSRGNRTGNLTGGPQVKQNQKNRERRQASARAWEETIVLEKPG